MTFPTARLTDGTWIAADDAERDAIGSNDGLQTGQICYNLAYKRLEFCITASASSSTWGTWVVTQRIKTAADPASGIHDGIEIRDILLQASLSSGTNDVTIYAIDTSSDVVLDIEVDLTVYQNGLLTNVERDTHQIIVSVISGTPTEVSFQEWSLSKGTPPWNITDYVISGSNLQVRITDTGSRTANLTGQMTIRRTGASITP